jgi:hypothetical protein
MGRLGDTGDPPGTTAIRSVPATTGTPQGYERLSGEVDITDDRCRL